jgi:hypothetical protein
MKYSSPFQEICRLCLSEQRLRQADSQDRHTVDFISLMADRDCYVKIVDWLKHFCRQGV